MKKITVFALALAAQAALAVDMPSLSHMGSQLKDAVQSASSAVHTWGNTTHPATHLTLGAAAGAALVGSPIAGAALVVVDAVRTALNDEELSKLQIATAGFATAYIYRFGRAQGAPAPALAAAQVVDPAAPAAAQVLDPAAPAGNSKLRTTVVYGGLTALVAGAVAHSYCSYNTPADLNGWCAYSHQLNTLAKNSWNKLLKLW